MPKAAEAETAREGAEEALAGLPDGAFLVRGPQAKRILSVVYKGKPTHHAIRANSETGVLEINTKTYGKQTRSLIGIILHLASAPKGWPVTLTYNGKPPAAELDTAYEPAAEQLYEEPVAQSLHDVYEMPVPRVETTHEQSTSTEKDDPPA